jgi:hypothetical protein
VKPWRWGVTDPADELAKGRIALWLEPELVAFIADEWRRLPNEVLDPVKEPWNHLAFQAATALHKAGIKYEPIFPER